VTEERRPEEGHSSARTDERPDDEPVLPTRAGEDREDSWGEHRDAGGRDAEWYRRQRPPHHE